MSGHAPAVLVGNMLCPLGTCFQLPGMALHVPWHHFHHGRWHSHFIPNRGDALVTACEASSASVAMPTLLHEAMQTSMQSMFGAQKCSEFGK